MRNVYLFSVIEDEDVTSSVFVFKDNALTHIAKHFSEYKKTGENTSEDIEYWRKSTGESLLLEKLKVEDY